jgi:transcriptional regulator with XRE-family HTH domain
MSMAALASQLGISRQYLAYIMAGERQPGPKVLRALGLRRETSYARSRQ